MKISGVLLCGSANSVEREAGLLIGLRVEGEEKKLSSFVGRLDSHGAI